MDFWPDFNGFYDTVATYWNNCQYFSGSAKDINSRFKSIRKGLKIWSKNLSQISKIIEQCSFVLAIMDGIEEHRDLSLQEHNFRKALRSHTQKLLEAKRLYWRKRANLKTAKLGDENTKFFHAICTQNFRNNHIAYIKDADGRIITEHENKAAILWMSFKERFGQTLDTQMLFNLRQNPNHYNLDHLEEPFTDAEIDEVIKCMPNDRSPGPDGFSALFMKKC